MTLIVFGSVRDLARCLRCELLSVNSPNGSSMVWFSPRDLGTLRSTASGELQTQSNASLCNRVVSTVESSSESMTMGTEQN